MFKSIAILGAVIVVGTAASPERAPRAGHQAALDAMCQAAMAARDVSIASCNSLASCISGVDTAIETACANSGPTIILGDDGDDKRMDDDDKQMDDKRMDDDDDKLMGDDDDDDNRMIEIENLLSAALDALDDVQAALDACPELPTAESTTAPGDGDGSTTAPGDESTAGRTIDDDWIISDDWSTIDGDDFASSSCAIAQSGRAANVATCNSLGFMVDSCIANVDAAIALMCKRRMRRESHMCDRAGLEQAFEQAQAQVTEAQNAKARAANNSASSIASAMVVVAVGLASALY